MDILARIAHQEGTNYNTERGYPYGVFDPRNHMFLYDDIVTQGDDLDYLEFCAEIEKAVQESDNVDELAAMLSDYDVPSDVLENAWINTDHEFIMDYLNDHGYTDSDESRYYYEYVDDYTGEKIRLQLGYLGGAPLVWVLDSPWVTKASYCSPCVPGAGNLDGGPHDSGDYVLCLPPNDMCIVWQAPIRLISEIESD